MSFTRDNGNWKKQQNGVGWGVLKLCFFFELNGITIKMIIGFALSINPSCKMNTVKNVVNFGISRQVKECC